MADVEKILRLVAEGALTAEEAEEILDATKDSTTEAATPIDQTGGARHLRIEVSDAGKRVVNLRVPLNIANWASGFLPGLSDQDTDRIRGAVASGVRGTILDIADDDGSRVLITSE
jgi:hypothetical protein